jgi:hypothetical protein
MNKTLLPLALLLAAGCACTPAPEETAAVGQEEVVRGAEDDFGPPVDETCPADEYQGFLGSPLAAVTYPAELDARIIRPGDMVTMEYDADRMNIRVDESGEITRVYCG